MYKRLFLLLSLLATNLLLHAQVDKKAMEMEDFAIWNTIESTAISNNGQWVVYEVRPGEGDTELRLYNETTGTDQSFSRAAKPKFSADNQLLVFMISPALDSVKMMRRNKVKKENLPKDTLAIMNLSTGELQKVPDVKKYFLPEKWSGWLAWHLEPSEVADTTLTPPKKESSKNGSKLVLLDYQKNERTELSFVTNVTIAENAARIVFETTGAGEAIPAGIYLFKGEDATTVPLFRGEATFEQLAISQSGKQVAFLADQDTTEARVRPFELWHWKENQDSAYLRLPAGNADFMSADWRLSEAGSLYFSKDDSKLFFGVAPQPVLQDTSLLDDEIVQVEVWTWKDAQIYPQQKLNAKREAKRTYRSVLHLNSGKFVQLADEQLPEVQLGNEGNAKHALAYTEAPYSYRSTWEGFPIARDVYVVDVQTGKRTLIAEELRGYTQLSPEAKYAYWYSYTDSLWMAYQISNGREIQLTTNEEVLFYDETDDHPDYPRPYGAAGWTTNDDYFMVYDRYDIWHIDPSGELKSFNMTNGRKDKRISRYIRLDREERAIEEVKPMLLHFQDEDTAKEGYQVFNLHTGVKKVLQEDDFRYSRRPLKAKDVSRYVFTKENYQTFPDLQYSRDLKNSTKISDANPQQNTYKWGSIEWFYWTAPNGERLRGMLVKPADFDPNKKYPMIVNFYEKSSDRLHAYPQPFPHRSTINYAYYPSRGYLIFNPDVPYKIGYPGESAYDAVVTGTTALINEGFVDADRIGLQGHSWGGYQIAYLVTKTDMFRCAESGAPVVNMISAYGGVRWGSGLSRMFQYEHTQSRIGGTLWEKPLRYLENSPIFFADKINTPILILHNDEDGAVPWYQGIEFYMALRRLQKPSWMLNYNGEPHWPVKLQNRKDFQLRMSQFFDHYLMDKPMPLWMKEGVPATEKGINQRLELIDEKE